MARVDLATSVGPSDQSERQTAQLTDQLTYHKCYHPDGLVLQSVDNFTWYIRSI